MYDYNRGIIVMDLDKIKVIVIDRKKEPKKNVLYWSREIYEIITASIKYGSKAEKEYGKIELPKLKLDLLDIIKINKYALHVDWAKSKLLELNSNLIKKLAKTIHSSIIINLPNDVPEEDLIQVGNTSFIKALRTYDPNMGTLGTYAYKIMRNDMIKEANAMQFVKKAEWRKKEELVLNF